MIGSIAEIITTSAFIPQVIKVLKTKDTSVISLVMYMMQLVEVFLWLMHGALIDDFSVLIANSVTFCMCVTILICKFLKNKSSEKQKFVYVIINKDI